MNDEIDLEKAVPDVPAQIVQHFSEIKDLEESPEAIALELCTLRDRMKIDKAREEKLLAFFKSKKDRGAIMYGSVMVDVKEEKGRLTVDWKGYISAQMTPAAVTEAERTYGKVGEPIIKVSVKRVGRADNDATVERIG